MPAEVTTRCALYVRVSTEEQAKNLSLDVQREACERYARAAGWDIEAVFIEPGESAKTASRTEFEKLVEYCRTKRGRVQYVVVYDVSRFMRNTQEHLALRARLASFGIQLRSPTQQLSEDPAGKLTETIFAAIAQYDNDFKAKRTREGMQAALSRGRWTHVAPLGYRHTRDEHERPTLAPDERAPLIRHAFELAANGVSQAEILRTLRALGLRTRKGGFVSAQTLCAILRHPLYAGQVRSHAWGVEAAGAFPAIVDERTWHAAQAQLGRKHPAEAHRRQREDFPLKHFVRCAVDGRPLTGYYAKGKTTKVPYYECPGCRARQGRDAFEDAFLAMLREIPPPPAFLELWKGEVLDEVKRQAAEADATVARLMKRAQEQRTRKERLVEAFVMEQAIDRGTYDEMGAKIAAELAAVELQLRDAQTERLDVVELLDYALDVVANAERLWREATHEQRQALQGFLFPDGIRWGKVAGFVRTQVSLFDTAALEETGAVVPVWRPSASRVRTWPPSWVESAARLRLIMSRAA